MRRVSPGPILRAEVPPGRAAVIGLDLQDEVLWQSTVVSRGDVLAVSASGANCVALVQEGRRCRVLYSLDGGLEWSTPWADVPEHLHVTAIQASADAAYLGLWSGGLDWEAAGAALPTDAVVAALAHSENRIVAGTQRHGLFVSDARRNGRVQWKPLAADPGSDAAGGVTALAFAGERLLSATSSGLLEVREGGAMVALDQGTRSAPVGIAAGRGDVVITWSPRAVRCSIDAGGTWFGLPDPPAGALVRGVAAAGRQVFATMQTPPGGAVYVWHLGAEAWRSVDGGLPRAASPACLVATPGGVLLGTAEHGIYRMPMRLDGEIIPADLLRLDEPPALVASSVVRFTTGSAGTVCIQLCNAAGACVREVVLEGLPPGSHAIEVADGNLPPGIYTIILQTHGTTVTCRRAILR